MTIYVYHGSKLLYHGPAPKGVGMLEFVPGCAGGTDLDLAQYRVKRIGFTLHGGVVVYVRHMSEPL